MAKDIGRAREKARERERERESDGDIEKDEVIDGKRKERKRPQEGS